jgi:hypothetical protein
LGLGPGLGRWLGLGPRVGLRFGARHYSASGATSIANDRDRPFGLVENDMSRQSELRRVPMVGLALDPETAWGELKWLIS